MEVKDAKAATKSFTFAFSPGPGKGSSEGMKMKSTPKRSDLELMEEETKARHEFAIHTLNKSFPGYKYEEAPLFKLPSEERSKVAEEMQRERKNAPVFYVPGSVHIQMKTPKFLFAQDFTAEVIEEEYPIGMMLALADEVGMASAQLWTRPNFDKKHYCRFTHDDTYPA